MKECYTIILWHEKERKNIFLLNHVLAKNEKGVKRTDRYKIMKLYTLDDSGNCLEIIKGLH